MEVQPTTKAPFDENDPRWRCCCKCTHVARGVKAIMILTYIGAGMYFLSFVSSLLAKTQASSSPLTTFFEFLLSLIQAILINIALNTVNPKYLTPTIVLHVLSLIMIIVALVVSIGATFVGTTASSASSSTKAAAVGIASVLFVILYGIYFGISAWLLSVIWKCYKYLKEKRMYLQSQENKA